MEAFVHQIAQLISLGEEEAVRALIEDARDGDLACHEIGMAILALRARDAAAGLRHARRAQELAPEDPLPFLYQLQAHVLLDEQEDAERCGRLAVARGGTAKSRMALGNVLLARGKPAEAADAFRELLRQDPGSGEALRSLAIAHFRLEDYAEAITCMARAYDLDPTDPAPIHALMEMFSEMGRLLGAMAAIRLVQQGQPPEEVPVVLELVTLQLTRLLTGKLPGRNTVVDVDETVGALLRDARSRPARVRLSVAGTLLDAERLAEARTILTPLAAEALDAKDQGRLQYLTGVLAERDEDPEAALVAYQAALALDGARADACTNAVSLLLSRGDADALAAIPTLLGKVATPQRQRTPQLLFNEALYLGRSGDKDGAQKVLARARRLGGEDSDFSRLCDRALEEL